MRERERKSERERGHQQAFKEVEIKDPCWSQCQVHHLKQGMPAGIGVRLKNGTVSLEAR